MRAFSELVPFPTILVSRARGRVRLGPPRLQPQELASPELPEDVEAAQYTHVMTYPRVRVTLHCRETRDCVEVFRYSVHLDHERRHVGWQQFGRPGSKTPESSVPAAIALGGPRILVDDIDPLQFRSLYDAEAIAATQQIAEQWRQRLQQLETGLHAAPAYAANDPQPARPIPLLEAVPVEPARVPQRNQQRHIGRVRYFGLADRTLNGNGTGEKEKGSTVQQFCVDLETSEGAVDRIWGADLERCMKQLELTQGDEVVLQDMGLHPAGDNRKKRLWHCDIVRRAAFSAAPG